MTEAVIIAVSLYMPGHLLGGYLTGKGDGWAESALLRVACAAAVCTPVLVALAVLGRFETPFILGALGVCAAVAWVLLPKSEFRARPGWWDLGALGAVIGGFALYAHPAEYVIKDRDPGVYSVVAAKLARTGELLIRDPLVGAVEPFHEFEYGVKYPGFYIHGDGLIVTQFFPGTFALLGIGDLMGGLWGGLYPVLVFGALSVGAASVLGGELFGRWAGLIGATLLAVSYAQVWWARYPSSEVLTQFFVLSGLWPARFVRRREAVTGILAGALLGGAMLVRVDAFLAAAAVPLLVGRDLLLGHPLGRWTLVCVPLLLLGGTALLYAATLGERYLDLIYELRVPGLASRLAPYLLGATLLVALTVWALRRRWSVVAPGTCWRSAGVTPP